MRLIDKAIREEKVITWDLWEITESSGSVLVGLECRIKTEVSLTRKLCNKSDSRIHDVLRYTNISEPPKYVKNFMNIVDQLSLRDYNISRVKNYWLKRSNPYNGINTNVVAPNGYQFELQFHTLESFDLKSGALHELYEEIRLLADMTAERSLHIQDEMFKLSDALEKPEDIDMVKDRK